MSQSPIIVWFREDLRLSDNPALDYAVRSQRPVVALYILETVDGRRSVPEAGLPRDLGSASRWWLHRSLEALGNALGALDCQLVLRAGDSRTVLPDLVEATGAVAVVWNRRYEAAEVAFDKSLKSELTEGGVEVESFNARLLAEPWEIANKQGGPFKVYSPFRRALEEKIAPRTPLKQPQRIKSSEQQIDSDHLDDWKLLPTGPDWAGGLRDQWTPGEAGAQERLEAFLETSLWAYKDKRDLPAADVTSRLSPYLRFGEISPHQIWHATKTYADAEGLTGNAAKSVEKFLSEVIWREFSYHLLWHYPSLAWENYQSKFNAFPWRGAEEAGKALERWQRGQTGYPIVDAAMRQLWTTGWMHNRLRMVVGSFLVKHLLIHWRCGEDWFWDTLVDADPASNAASWQWVAGSGADAAPYFRIFNPMTQGSKFDSDGAFVRQWVPELEKLPDKHIHEPWSAPESVLEKAGVRLGDTYPEPMVDHSAARKRALSAFEGLKSADGAEAAE